MAKLKGRTSVRRSGLSGFRIWWLALVACGLLGLFSALDWQQRAQEQAQRDLDQALDWAAGQLEPLIAAGDFSLVRAQLIRLVNDSQLGFRQLEWRSIDGELLGRAGRHDGLKLPLMAEAYSQSLQTWLNEQGDERGRLRLAGPSQDASWLLYVRSDPAGAQARGGSGWLLPALGMLIALVGAGLLWLRRDALQPVAARPPAERIAPRQEVRERRRPQVTGDELTRADLGHALGMLDRGVLVIDSGQRIRYINATAVRLTGWPAIDALGALAYSVLHPMGDDEQPLKLPSESVQASGREAQLECRLRTRDGTLREVEILAAPFSAGAGRSVLMLVRDLGETADPRAELERSLRGHQQVLDHLQEGVIRTDAGGRILWVNARIQRLFGYREAELSGVPVTKLIPVPFMNSPAIRLTDFIGQRAGRPQPRVVGWRKDATTFPVGLVVDRISVDGNEELLLLIRDHTEQLRSESLSLRLGRLLDEASQEILVFDAQTLYFTEVNQGARRNLGYSAEDLARMSLLDLAVGLDREALEALLEPLRAGEQESVVWQAQHRCADGSDYAVRFKIQYSRDEQPPVFLAIGGAALEH